MPSSTTIYIGQMYKCTGTQCTKYIISGTQIVAQISAAGTYYYHSDHLGSSSIITAGSDVAGKQAGDQIEDIFYYPYGETQINYGEVNMKYGSSCEIWLFVGSGVRSFIVTFIERHRVSPGDMPPFSGTL